MKTETEKAKKENEKLIITINNKLSYDKGIYTELSSNGQMVRVYCGYCVTSITITDLLEIKGFILNSIHYDENGLYVLGYAKEVSK